MGYTVFYGGQTKTHDYEGWDACAGDYIRDSYQTKTNSRRRRRYYCVGTTSNNIGWKGDGSGGQACSGIGKLTPLGGNSNFVGRDQNFPGAFAGYKCELDSAASSAGNIKSYSAIEKWNTASAKDNNGQSKSLYQQLLFGITTQHGSSQGFCYDVKNLATVVQSNGDTCYKMLQQKGETARAVQFGAKYCASNPTDSKCKCVNGARSDYINDCKRNPNWAGCKEIVSQIKAFEDAGLKSATGLFGNATCLVPNICEESGLYLPTNGKISACANQTAICNQVMTNEKIEALGGLTATQECKIQFGEKKAADEAAKKKAAEEAVAAKRKADEAAAAKRKADEAAAAKRKADEAAAAKRKVDEAAAAKGKVDEAAATPQTGVGQEAISPPGMGQNTKIAIGVGGLIALISCLLVVVIMVSSGGGRRRR